MPYSDPEQKRQSSTERSRAYRARKHAERYGPDAGNMSGRHGNQARGDANGRWNGGKMRTSHGYIAVRVPDGHHLQQAHGYAYEHDLVAESMLGRPLDTSTEIVHHINGNRDDNRPENLTVESRVDHAREHTSVPGARDELGRFSSTSRLRKGARRSEGAAMADVTRCRHGIWSDQTGGHECDYDIHTPFVVEQAMKPPLLWHEMTLVEQEQLIGQGEGVPTKWAIEQYATEQAARDAAAQVSAPERPDPPATGERLAHGGFPGVPQALFEEHDQEEDHDAAG